MDGTHFTIPVPLSFACGHWCEGDILTLLKVVYNLHVRMIKIAPFIIKEHVFAKLINAVTL